MAPIEQPLQPMPPVQALPPSRMTRILRWIIPFVILLGVAYGVYVVSGMYELGIGRFFAAETVTCVDAGYMFPSDVCVEATCGSTGNAAPCCEKKQQWQGKLFDNSAYGQPAYCFACDDGALQQYCSGGPGPTPTTSSCNAQFITGSITGDQATVTNNSEKRCDVTFASFEVYKRFDGFLETQILHDVARATLNPGESADLAVRLPDCSYQTDLAAQEPPQPPRYNGNLLIDANIHFTDYLCDGTCIGNSCQATPTPTPAVTPTPTPTPTPSIAPAPISCTVSPAQVTAGQQTATATVTGGTAPYTWTAPGGSPASGSGASFAASFATVGKKEFTVKDSANRQATCTVEVVAQEQPLTCSPASQTAGVNDPKQVAAAGGTAPYTWSVSPDGSLSTAAGASTTATFTTSGTKQVTVRDSGSVRTASCTIIVSQVVPPFACSPSSQSVAIGQTASFQAVNGTARSFTWTAPGGSPVSGSGTAFAASFAAAGTYTVTVASADVTASRETASCTVTVTGSTDRNPQIGIIKTVRNVTQNGALADLATANPNDTVEFELLVSASGGAIAQNVRVADTLPAGLSYVFGSTRVDGVQAADGIIADGILLGSMSPGRTIVVRFQARIGPEAGFPVGTTSLTNIGRARGDNVAEVTDPAFLSIVRQQTGQLTLAITKLGRNISRNESSEQSSVTTSPAQILEFIVRVRNTSSVQIMNAVARDIVPNGMSPIPGTVSVNGSPAADTLTSTGLPLGTLQPGEERIIRVQMRVFTANALPRGTTTVVNVVQVSADSVPTIVAQLPIIIVNPPVGTVGTTQTGPGEATTLALIISAIVTLLYVGYSGSPAYRRHEASSIARQEERDDRFNFKR